MNSHAHGGLPAAKIAGWKQGAARVVLVAAMLVLAAGTITYGAESDAIIFPATGQPAGNTPPGAAISGGLNSLTLLLAAGLAAGGGWIMWRNRRRAPSGTERHTLAVEETRPLGNRQYLVVASYEGRRFLLGVCPGRIDLLAPLAAESTSRRSE